MGWYCGYNKDNQQTSGVFKTDLPADMDDMTFWKFVLPDRLNRLSGADRQSQNVHLDTKKHIKQHTGYAVEFCFRHKRILRIKMILP